METVYLSRDYRKLAGLIELPEENTGLKVHFGEKGNKTYPEPEIIRFFASKLKKPVLIETNVLYKGSRTTAGIHRKTALEHGFGLAPIDLLDGDAGEATIEVPAGLKHFKTVFLGKGIEKYRNILVISHFKGHIMAGFGGAIKNLGMGLAARKGKLAMHANLAPYVEASKCISCGICAENCTANAICICQERSCVRSGLQPRESTSVSEHAQEHARAKARGVFLTKEKALISNELCIGCAKCIAVCPEGAIKVPWQSTSSEELQEKIAEYAYGAVKGRDCYFINLLVKITKDCDCVGMEMKPIMKDIGFLASKDPVAIDQACYDLCIKEYGEDPFRKLTTNPEAQLRHAEEIGLGSRKYELVEL